MYIDILYIDIFCIYRYIQNTKEFTSKALEKVVG